jgi:hypothetical protein
MINQIAPVPPKTSPLPGINRGLIQARHIQADLKNRIGDDAKPEKGILWSPVTAGPYLVPILRWIE